MSNEQKFIIAIAFIVGLFVSVTVVGCMVAYNQRLKSAMELGYEEGSIQGMPGIHWLKTKDKPDKPQQ